MTEVGVIQLASNIGRQYTVYVHHCSAKTFRPYLATVGLGIASVHHPRRSELKMGVKAPDAWTAASEGELLEKVSRWVHRDMKARGDTRQPLIRTQHC